ncbi:MAG: ribonuclease [Verrucomicrobiales bacterium]|nr:ribonuclease [Verrucomicrobiales bacterium]
MSLERFLIDGALLLGGSFGVSYYFVRKKEKRLKVEFAAREKNLFDTTLKEAENKTRESRLQAAEEILRMRDEHEKVLAARRQELASLEGRVTERESLVNRQLENLVGEEKTLRQQKTDLKERLANLITEKEQLNTDQKMARDQLAAITRMTEQEAKEAFLKQVQEDAQRDAGHLVRHILDDAKLRAEEKARRIISTAIQRYAGEHTNETSTAIVALTGDEIKGRIIGREGRNIRAFEAATGVTVMIDDTPNAVVLSGFDPVRREIAREAMERLILDGRIHPTRIEEVVAKVTQEMDETIIRLGEEAVMKTGIPPLHIEIVKMLGRLGFRHSFSQNILNHSVEVSHLMGLMASELGIDVQSAKKAGLLHDIGKAMGHEIEGAHAIVGADFVKRYGESEQVVNGVASHHDEVPHIGILGILVSAADAMSASRPGARSETMTTYIKRVEDLERIGCSFPGVEKCYAVQAGRELRVMVQPDTITDEQAFKLARTIARKIEEELQYPGQIRITVMRETRCVEFAK